MTKEQAIEILKCFKDNEIQRDKLEIDNRCDGWKIGRIYKSLELNTAIETVLSMLKEEDKQIDLMAEQLTTPIHDKKWVKEYFENRAKEVK
jgi:hypothetical protein